MSIIKHTLIRFAMQKKKHQEEMAALAANCDFNASPMSSCDDVASQCFFSTLNATK